MEQQVFLGLTTLICKTRKPFSCASAPQSARRLCREKHREEHYEESEGECEEAQNKRN